MKAAASAQRPQRAPRGGGPPAAPRPRRLSLIVAMARNRVIGANGAIPWHLPNELQLFKRVTMGHHIIMGRKTWESIGRLLPGRTTVIVTRRPGYRVAGAIVAGSLEQALAACSADDEAFVIGGGELYRAALPAAQRLYLTIVDAEPDGDTLMPEFDASQWREVSAQRFEPDDRHRHGYRFSVLERVGA
jgi:dihydrofolate reductase